MDINESCNVICCRCTVCGYLKLPRGEILKKLLLASCLIGLVKSDCARYWSFEMTSMYLSESQFLISSLVLQIVVL